MHALKIEFIMKLMLELVVTSRNRSIYVKTLHTLLAIEGICNHFKLPINITFTRDDNKEKLIILKKLLKSGNRIIWFDYGVSCDQKSIQNIVRRFDGYDGIIFPVVNEGIDWQSFKTKVKSGSKEPSSQMGLTFDTDIDTKKPFDSENDFYVVTKTDPHLWCFDSKSVVKKLRDKKSGLVLPTSLTDFFDKCIKKNVKFVAAADSKTYNHFTHECVGNIMNISNLKVTG